jgi:hypothetical protein
MEGVKSLLSSWLSPSRWFGSVSCSTKTISTNISKNLKAHVNVHNLLLKVLKLSLAFTMFLTFRFAEIFTQMKGIQMCCFVSGDYG